MSKDAYLKVRDEAEMEWSERPEHYNERGTKTKKRRYSFKAEKVAMLQKEKAKNGWKFINPYNKFGAYYGVVEALGQLGINEWHSYKKMETKMKEIMSSIECKGGISSWEKFVGRMPKSSNSKTFEGKIQQNASTLQRFDENAYGWKLAQFGECLDIKVENDNYYYRLNCEWLDKLDWTNPDEAIMAVEPIKPKMSKKNIETSGTETEDVSTEKKEVVQVDVQKPEVEMSDIHTI